MADDFLGSPFANFLALIQANHPDIMAILSKPGVMKVVTDATNAEQAGTPWTTAQFNAALQATPYYQSTTEQSRNWDALKATDPATARTKIDNTRDVIRDLQTQLGVTLSDEGGLNSMAFTFLQTAISEGWSADQIKYHLLGSVNKTIVGNQGWPTGDLGQYATDIKKTMDDYGVPMSDKAIMDWAQKLAQGAVDQNSILGYAQSQAESLYPGLAAAIHRGITVRQYADPYMQIAQQELGIDPKNEAMTNPKWMRAINSVDPKTKERVSMSLSDWTAVVRSDPTYGYDKTEKAASQGASFASNIARMMGATG